MAFQVACEKVFISTITNSGNSYSRELNEWLRVANNPASKATTHAGTTLYSLVSSESVPGVPEIPRSAKAVVLNFSGSGTKSSGKVAMRDAPVYLAHDIALVSFDYPFQGQGSRDMKLFRSWRFKKQVFEIVRYLKKSGLPIYAVGHSFGPIVIQELLADSPHLFDGAIYISPGGEFSPGYKARYEELVANGQENVEWQSIQWDNIAKDWTDGPKSVSSQFRSNKGVAQKTDRPVLFITGDMDIWGSADLAYEAASGYQNAKVEVAKGATHTGILNLQGKNERLVVELAVDFIQENSRLSLPAHLISEDPITLIRYYFNNSSLFRSWAEQNHLNSSNLTRGQFPVIVVLEKWRNWYVSFLLEKVRSQGPLSITRDFVQQKKLMAIMEKPLSKVTLNDADLIASLITKNESLH